MLANVRRTLSTLMTDIVNFAKIAINQRLNERIERRVIKGKIQWEV